MSDLSLFDVKITLIKLLERSGRAKYREERNNLLIQIDFVSQGINPETGTEETFSSELVDALLLRENKDWLTKFCCAVYARLGSSFRSEFTQIAQALELDLAKIFSETEPTSKRSVEEGKKPARSLLVVNGLSLDKKKIKDILSQIAVDNDLAELRVRSSQYFESGEAVCRFLSQWSEQFKIHPSRDGFCFDMDRDLKGQTQEVQQGISRLLAKPKKEFEESNFSVWSPFLSNLSDAQVLLLGTTFQGERPVNYFFCAEPYYRVRFIDSLILRLNIEPESIRKLWEKTRDDVAKSLAAKFLVENLDLPIKDAFEPFSSGFGYGILALSRFFKELTNLFKGQLSVGFNIEGEGQFFAKECIELVAAPEAVSFESPEKSDVTITALFESRKYRPLSDDELRVPIKRPFALPKNLLTGNVEPRAYLPRSDSVAMGEQASILFVGGAEHNLPLLHVVNRLRWEKKYRIGIAENKFCTVGSHKFLIGSENFVYGIGPAGREGMVGFMTRERLEASKQNCEILSFRVPAEKSTEFQAFCVYGYSAVMTRIGAAILAEALEGKTDTMKKFLPLDEEEPGELGNFLYSFKEAQREEKWKEFLQLWDARDLLNKTVLSPDDVTFLSEHISRKKTTST